MEKSNQHLTSILSLVILLALAGSSRSLRLDCRFSSFFWASLSHTYTCDAQVTCDDGSTDCAAFNPLVLQSSTFHEDASKTNDDVHGLLIAHQRHVTKFPKGLEDTFRRLKAIDLEGCGLTSISGSDLLPFPELVQISLEDNRLTELPPNLFAHNRGLKRIDLEGNGIMHVGLGIFSHLSDLTTVYMRHNQCTSENSLALKREDLKFLAWELQVECPATLPMLSSALVHSPVFKANFKTVAEEKFRALNEQIFELERQIRQLKQRLGN